MASLFDYQPKERSTRFWKVSSIACLIAMLVFLLWPIEKPFHNGAKRADPKLRIIQVSNETLTLQISSCNQNDGVKYWTVTIKEGYVVKTSIVCNNGMVKDFEAKDI